MSFDITTLISTSAVIVLILSVLGLSLGRGQGQGDHLLPVDGVLFAFPEYVWHKIVKVRTRAETSVIRSFEQLDARCEGLNKRLNVAKTAKERRKLAADYEAAKQQRAALLPDTNIAVTDAARRWLLSAEGQQWCAVRGIHFPLA